jgi:phospholipid-transporting ATPase
VQYVLSDKTGTLTQNVMGFVWASIGGRLYGRAAHAAQAAAGRGGGAAAAPLAPVKGPSSGGGGVAADAPPPPNTPHTIALDSDLRAAAAVAGSPGAEFLLALALCNTVVPTATDAGALLYQAASPDEEALVAGAAYLGTKLVARWAIYLLAHTNMQCNAMQCFFTLDQHISI